MSENTKKGLTKKQIAFDLEVAQLKKYYPRANWNYAYEDIKKHMKANGFEWKQGSVYVSKKPIGYSKVRQIVRSFINNNIWINKCMRDCRVTRVDTRVYNITNLFNRDVNIPVRQDYKDKTDEKRHIKELKQNGFQPSRGIISAMERIDKAYGKYTNLQTISDIYKGKEPALTPEIKSCAKEIGDSLKSQELSRVSYR